MGVIHVNGIVCSDEFRLKCYSCVALWLITPKVLNHNLFIYVICIVKQPLIA